MCPDALIIYSHLRRILKRRLLLRNIVVAFLVFLTYVCCATRASSSSFTSHENELLHILRTCAGFVGSFERQREGSSTISHEIVEILALIDHIFVISLEGCDIKLPLQLRSRSSCIKGRVLDGCVPEKYIRGKYNHAMKVTFSHAMILHMSRVAGYKHIAVLEDDISFVRRFLSPRIFDDFSRLLQSDSWNLIRLGFRPYFLQENGAQPCPDRCRCKLDTNFGDHLCEMRQSGCDIRSSDFFILHSGQFHGLEAHLVDIDLENSRRIIDVHPLRSIGNQWLFLPHISYQKSLDIPVDYQLGAGALYVKKCAGPRPISETVSQQLVVPFGQKNLSR